MSALRFTEVASLAVLAFSAAMQARAGREALRRFLVEAALIGVSAWLAEDLCIRWFGFYAYPEGWLLRLDRVPLMVGVIWPFVILSARDVVRSLLGPRLLPPAGMAALAGLLICFDASLVEPVAVRAGLWAWSEPGVFAVPPIGIAGWGVFGAVCTLWLEVAGRTGRPWLRFLLPLVAPPLANGLLVVLWWGGLRWVLRGEWPLAAVLCASLGASALFLFLARDHRASASLDLMAPRAAGALLFFGLLAARFDAGLAAYAASFAPPYLWITRWRQPSAGDTATPPPGAGLRATP